MEMYIFRYYTVGIPCMCI